MVYRYILLRQTKFIKCFAKMPNQLSLDDLNKMWVEKWRRSIDVAITRIRKKLKKIRDFNISTNHRGFGWKLNTFNSKEFKMRLRNITQKVYLE